MLVRLVNRHLALITVDPLDSPAPVLVRDTHSHDLPLAFRSPFPKFDASIDAGRRNESATWREAHAWHIVSMGLWQSLALSALQVEDCQAVSIGANYDPWRHFTRNAATVY